MNEFFSPQVLDGTRLLVLQGERVANPDFYPMLRSLDFNNLPDQSTMGAITFSDLVVLHEAFTNGLLFHELVHVEQYRQLEAVALSPIRAGYFRWRTRVRIDFQGNRLVEVALDLLRRLLAGERGKVPMHLAMLLEKSSPCDHGDEHYRQVLPPELADVRLSPETNEEITGALCAEISHNPDQALIFTISFTGADQATKTATHILVNPPRPLTMSERRAALAVVNSYLPHRLAEHREFLQRADLEGLARVAEEIKNVEETGTNEEDRAARIGIRMHAAELLRSLRLHGIIGS